jgi:hypothetical protein
VLSFVDHYFERRKTLRIVVDVLLLLVVVQAVVHKDEEGEMKKWL